MSDDVEAVERAVLQILERGALGWHALAVRLGTVDVPRGHDLLTVLAGLRARGLVINVRGTDGSDRWQLTDPGRALVATTTPDDELIAALRGGPSAVIASHRALLADDAAYEAELRRLLAARRDAIDAVAQGAQLLPEARRAVLARELWTSSDTDVRRALYRVLEPTRLEKQGCGWKALPDDAWEAFVSAGLDDADGEIRRMAAALVFATAAGGRFREDLMLLNSRAQLENVATRETVLLALGSADDADSLAALRAAASGADDRLAAAAVRALAARPDGRADALAAIDDARAPVRAAAEFALAHVIDAIDSAQLAILDDKAQRSASARDALARYRKRVTASRDS